MRPLLKATLAKKTPKATRAVRTALSRAVRAYECFRRSYYELADSALVKPLSRCFKTPRLQFYEARDLVTMSVEAGLPRRGRPARLAAIWSKYLAERRKLAKMELGGKPTRDEYLRALQRAVERLAKKAK